MEVNIVMNNRYLNFSSSRLKAGFLAILLISATAVTPVKAGWFSNFFSADTDNKIPMIVFAAAVFATAGIGFVCYHFLFKNKKKPNQDNTTDAQPDEQTDTNQSDNNNSEKISPATSTFICSDEDYLANAANRFSGDVPGKVLKITDDVSVVQFHVFNQYTKRINSSGKKISVTGDDSCGYHALDNASHLIKFKNGKIPQFPEIGKISQQYGSLENSQYPGGGRQRNNIIQQRNRKKILGPVEKMIKNFISYGDNEQHKEKIEEYIGDIAIKLAAKTYQLGGELEIDSKTINKYMLENGKHLIDDNTIKLNNNDKKYVLLIDKPTSNQQNKYPGYECIMIKTECENEKGESLYGDELNGIITNNFNQEMYSVIENMKMFDIGYSAFLFGDSKNVKNKIKKLKKLVQNNEPFSHAFIISTARVIEQGKQKQDKGTYGHYFTVVARSNGNKRTYIIADSTNKVRLYGDHNVKNIVEMIEGEQVAQNLILPNNEQTQFKKKDLDLMSLATRYKQWSGRPLPASTIKQIEKSFSD